MKLCKDCKYCRMLKFQSDGFCDHPKNGINAVTGKIKSTLCSQERDKPMYNVHRGECGPTAVHFTPKKLFKIWSI